MNPTPSPTFTQLLERSTIVSGVLAIMAFAGFLYIVIARIPVDGTMTVVLVSIVSAVLATFFIQRSTSSTNRIAESSSASTQQMAAEFANNMRLAAAESNKNIVAAVQQMNDANVQHFNQILAAMQPQPVITKTEVSIESSK